MEIPSLKLQGLIDIQRHLGWVRMWGGGGSGSVQWLVFETGLILVSLGFGYFCGGLCAGMVLVWVGGGVRRDGLGHLDSEVAFHRSTCRSSIGSFLLRFMQDIADRICSIAVMLLSSCLHSLQKVGQAAFSSFPTLCGWLASLQGSPRALQHQGPGAGQAANRRTDREDRTLAAIGGHQQGNPGHRTANYFEQNALFFMSCYWVLVPNYKYCFERDEMGGLGENAGDTCETQGGAQQPLIWNIQHTLVWRHTHKACSHNMLKIWLWGEPN